MKRLAYPQYKISPYFIVASAYILYIVLFTIYFDRSGAGIMPLAIIPVIGGSWYFGIKGGILTAVISILTNMTLPTILGYDLIQFNSSPGNVIGSIALLLLAVIIGKMATVTRERREALIRLEELEKDRRDHTKFLELLNEITGTALQANNLGSSLKILVEHTAKLFEADDCFLAFWNETNKVITPIVAYGSMSDKYPSMRFEPGEKTLGAAALEAGHSIAIPDLANSPYVSPRVAPLFHNRSMLGIPVIVQGRKLASLYLGYDMAHAFEQIEIARAEIVAHQIGLILTKLQLLEDAQKQVMKLTALHDVALATIEVDNEDQLIEHVTDIIGRNLFPDNFGILLMDETRGVLHPHPSYRFGSARDWFPNEITLGQGISGQVAQTGQLIRIGNVRGIQNYLEVDQATSSELCVPIKLKERVLGVINAESTRTDGFSVDDEFLLGTLAGQLATTIEQLRTAQAERRWLDQLAHSNELIYALAHITTHIEKALSKEEIIQTMGEELNKIDLTCVMAVYEKDRSLFTINYSSIESRVLEQIENGLSFPMMEYSFSLEKLKSILKINDIPHPIVITNPEDEIQLLFTQRREKDISEILQKVGIGREIELLRLPLIFEESLQGILWVWGKGIMQADLPIMSIFAKQIGISLERARLFQEVQSLALTDPLTGLQNRRSLFELGRIEFSRAQRMKRPFCCMMLDLDHFKQINDNYGHPVGDKVIQEFAKRCKNSVREGDLIGRYGGEELLIFLPETDSEMAMQVAERLRKSVDETPIQVSDQELSVTVSIGVSRKDENTLQLETLIARADQAMYIAKHKGRNIVAISV